MRNVRRCVVLALISATLFSAACGRKRHRVRTARQPIAKPQISVPVGTTEQGLASWYGVPYDGRPAADGEIYHMEQLVAAHRTMPFNTWLKVTNMNNGRSVNVRVIDRGPFVKSRIIDLSKAAANQIQMLGPGVAPVRIEVISAPVDVPSTDFYAVQIGAFASSKNAERLRGRYAAQYGYAEIEIKQGRVPLYRVLVGRLASADAAEQLADQLRREAGQVFVVRLDLPAGAAAAASGESSAGASPSSE